MKTIAVLGSKGGGGKSTIAVHLAVCAFLAGTGVALVDIDPQLSAAKWKRRRTLPGGPEIVSAVPSLLPNLLQQASENGAEILIVDTAPHTDAATIMAAEVADICLIPCRPSAIDIDAAMDILAILKSANLLGKCHAILNAVPSQGRAADQVEAGLAAYIPVLPVRLGQRSAYARAWNDGRSVQEYDPRGKAAEEIQALYRWVIEA